MGEGEKMANSAYLTQKEDELTNQCEMSIRAEETTRDQIINQAEGKRPSKDKKSSGLVLAAVIIGIIGGIALQNFLLALIIFIVVLLCGFGIRKSSDSSQNQAIDKEINDIRNRCSENIRKLKADKDRKITAMRAEYDEKTSKSMKGYLKTSKTAELENWLAKRFFAQINGADRRPHIKDITATYTYSVQQDKVVGDDGVFDFEIQCYQKLSNIYDQIGLARAICKKIQRTTENTYKIDVNGAKPTISRSSNDYTITLTYSAPNGKYQFAKSWK
jgi:acid phosphatase family membrane protein YuiD